MYPFIFTLIAIVSSIGSIILLYEKFIIPRVENDAYDRGEMEGTKRSAIASATSRELSKPRKGCGLSSLIPNYKRSR